MSVEQEAEKRRDVNQNRSKRAHGEAGKKALEERPAELCTMSLKDTSKNYDRGSSARKVCRRLIRWVLMSYKVLCSRTVRGPVTAGPGQQWSKRTATTTLYKSAAAQAHRRNAQHSNHTTVQRSNVQLVAYIYWLSLALHRLSARMHIPAKV